MEGYALDMIGGLFPTGFENNLVVTSYYISAILVIHALISSYMVKEVDGGNKVSLLSDFVIMMWIGAVIEFIVTLMFKGMFGSYFGVGF